MFFDSGAPIFWEILIADILFRILKILKIKATIITIWFLLFNNQVPSRIAEAADWNEICTCFR